MHYTHYTVMFCIMIISGLLSTMNIWADKADDIRFSINDIYMTLLMAGWMFVFMGIYDTELPILGIGILLVGICIWCIRTQFLVTNEQYILGMIPHHSMAVHMSRQLLRKQPGRLRKFVKNILETQQDEIRYMKSL